ncbi:MAG: transporter substrate-binding domain-containing protein, partial [Vulcanimicrobiaceae bacterium]
RKLFWLFAIPVLLVTVCAGSSAAPAPKLSAPVPAELRAKGVLTVGVKCDYPPFGYVDTSGKTVGYDVDFARQLATFAFGKPDAVQTQCVSSADRIPYLTTHRVDVVIATLGYNADRARVIAFSKPYFSQTGRVLVTKQSGLKDVKEFAGKTVLTLKGTPYGKWFQDCLPAAKITEYETTSQALIALKEGRGQGYADDDTLLIGIAGKDPSLTVIGSLYSSKYGVGMRLDDDAMIKWVNAAITRLQSQDFFFSQFKKWVPDKHLQDLFAESMPRPGHDLTYPAGPVVHC